VTVDIEFTVPTFNTLLVDELKAHCDWILLKFNAFTFKNLKTKSSSLVNISVKKISLIDLNMPVNSCLIG
jgi:hypothetical protein